MGRLALPAHVDRLQVLHRPDEEPTAVAVATPAAEPGRFDCRVLDQQGTVVLELEGYRTIPLPGELADDVRGPLQHALVDSQ